MIRLRRRLTALAVVWVCSQLTLLTGSAVVLASVSDDAACSCTQGVMCPMHHPRPLGPAQCAMQSATSHALLPMMWFSTPGVVSHPIVTITPAPVDRAVPQSVRIPISSSRHPESPPPRA